MHLPFTPNHVQLISDCYPPQAALLASTPEYRPNSQELSRLLYYAVNKPAKINKLTAELEKRLSAECRKAQSGNTRFRASLLITLSIYKALVMEFRRDIPILSTSLILSVHTALSALPSDLELAAKTASVFTAWTTYTDGHVIGADRTVTRNYLNVLRVFSDLSKFQSNDHEVRNRTRLVGLAALDGVVSSGALFNASPCFEDQVAYIVPAILATIYQAETSVLEHETSAIKETPDSPYLPKARPITERRAASVHIHKDGDKGPSFSDVVYAALHVYRSLVGQSNGAQLGLVMQAAFNSLDVSHGWDQVDHSHWLAQVSADWAQYQYRYAVPTRLVERLLEIQDTPSTTKTHATMTTMVTTVFVSPTPLVNLSTSDMVSNLINLVLRRTALDPDDPLLPALAQSMASLGTHVYYADQIQDLAAELISRLTVVETGGIGPRGKGSNSQKCRSQAIRCLLAGLLGLIHAADDNQAKHTGGPDDEASSLPLPTTETNNFTVEHDHTRVHPSRRTKVSPEVWIDTLTLLCDGNYAVRADYAQALISYIEVEVPRKDGRRDVGGMTRMQSLSPTEQARAVATILYGDSVTRFLNSLHVHVYALATSSSLETNLQSSSGVPSTPMDGDPAAINVIPATPVDSRATFLQTQTNVVDDEANGALRIHESPPRSESQSRRSTIFGGRSRQASALSRLLDGVSSAQALAKSSSSATLSDYAHILAVLSLIHEKLPMRAILTGVPMLCALEQAMNGDFGKHAHLPRLNIIREVLIRVWLVIGKVWDCQQLVEAAKQALDLLPYPSYLPAWLPLPSGVFNPPREPMEFPGADSSATNELVRGVDVEQAIVLLSANSKVQEATGLDTSGLLARLSKKWSADQAFKDSVEIQPSPDAFRAASLLRVTPTLTNIDNLSLQSLGRFNRGVGVTDLREALEGRGSMSNPALANKPASVSTLDHAPSSVGDAAPSAPGARSNKKKQILGAPGEVRDALDRLGIGSSSKSNRNGLKLVSSMQKTDLRIRALIR